MKIMSLSYLGQQLTIYAGFSIGILGVIGNSVNVLIFSSVRRYRQSPCTFYFLIESIYNIIYILINLTTRILSVGYKIDFIPFGTIWCKIREFSLFTPSLITLTCSCLAIIDQYLMTSPSVHRRRFSNIKWSHRIIVIVMIVWCFHGIPYLLFYDVSPITKTCINTNPAYAIYIPISLLSLICGVPVLIMILFGYLTYRNIRLTRVLLEQQADRQLTRMTLVQVILIVICILPYGINNTYTLITSGIAKDPNRLLAENFASTILSVFPYIYYSGSFYTFLISSSRFRRSVKEKILFWQRQNQINPVRNVRIFL